jgi:hypothetical protein
MHKILKKGLLLGTIVGVCVSFTGCGSNQPKKADTKNVEVSFPWVDFCNDYTNKYIKTGGFAECSCEEASTISDTDFAKDIADADARTKLANSLEVKIASLMEGHKSRVRTSKKERNSSSYEKTFKQLVKQNVQGSYPVTHKIFRTAENKYKVCSVVVLDPEKVKKIISLSAKEADITDPKDTELLYEEFKAYKAQQRLNKELNQ